MDDFRKGAEKGRKGGDAPQGEPPSGTGWFQGLATWKKASLVALGGLALVIAVAVGAGEEEAPVDQAPTEKAGKNLSGKVTVRVLEVETDAADPFGADDPTFNENQTIYRVKVRVENGTRERVLLDPYLQRSPDQFVAGVGDGEGAMALIQEAPSGGEWEGNLYFGWLTMDPPPTTIRIENADTGKRIYVGPV